MGTLVTIGSVSVDNFGVRTGSGLALALYDAIDAGMSASDFGADYDADYDAVKNIDNAKVRKGIAVNAEALATGVIQGITPADDVRTEVGGNTFNLPASAGLTAVATLENQPDLTVFTLEVNVVSVEQGGSPTDYGSRTEWFTGIRNGNTVSASAVPGTRTGGTYSTAHNISLTDVGDGTTDITVSGANVATNCSVEFRATYSPVST